MDPPLQEPKRRTVEQIVADAQLPRNVREKVALNLTNIFIYGKPFTEKTKYERLKISSSHPAKDVELTIAINAHVGKDSIKRKEVGFRELPVTKVDQQAENINGEDFGFLSEKVRHELQRYLYAYCQTASDYAIYVGDELKAKRFQQNTQSKGSAPQRELDLQSANKGPDNQKFSKDEIEYDVHFEYTLGGTKVFATFVANIFTESPQTNEEQINAHNRRIKEAALSAHHGKCSFTLAENFLWLEGKTESPVEEYVKQLNLDDRKEIKGEIKRENHRLGDELVVTPAALAEQVAKLIKKVTHRKVVAGKVTASKIS